MRPTGNATNVSEPLIVAAIVLLAASIPMSFSVVNRPAYAAPPQRLICHNSLKTQFRPDALTTVRLVKAFKKGEPLVLSEPATAQTARAPNDLCLVKLNVGPGNPGPADAPSTSPGIGIEVWLPTPANWNERIHTTGGLGGYDGGAHSSLSQIGWYRSGLVAGEEGAVSASTDSGHAATDGSWGMNPDGTLAKPLWIDFAHRAMHEMAVKTKALTLAYYGRPAKFSYYEGASTGGRHGYRLAQEYPNDYDGIIANLPAMNWTEWVTAAAFQKLVVQRDLGGIPLTEAQQDLASNAAIHTCDLVGDQHLGYIMDNVACRYDPTKDPGVLCISDGGRNATADCLTRVQANAINKFWYGITSDGSVPSPEVDNGAGAALTGNRRWYGMMRGTSLYNVYFTKLDPVYSKLLRDASASGSGREADQLALQLVNPTLAGPTFKNASGNGRGLWKELSYVQLNNAFDRGVALDPVFGRLASDNPDLSAFKARGGKMLSWHGWNDEAIPVQGTIRYYDRVVEKLGGLPRVESFFKLYLVPGGGHMSPQGTSNPNANPPAVAPGQFYKLLVDWVEKHIEPGRVEIESPTERPVKRRQPICPYPQTATYVSGDPNAATSFRCTSISR